MQALINQKGEKIISMEMASVSWDSSSAIKQLSQKWDIEHFILW